MNAERMPKPGERWLFKVWADHRLNYRGAVRVVSVGDGSAHQAPVVVRFEASGNELVTNLAGFLRTYTFDDDQPEPDRVDVVGPTSPRPRLEVVT